MYYRNQPISCVLVTTQRVEKHEKKKFYTNIYYFIFPTNFPIEYTHGKRCNGITQ